jgi:hypothetical protein
MGGSLDLSKLSKKDFHTAQNQTLLSISSHTKVLQVTVRRLVIMEHRMSTI